MVTVLFLCVCVCVFRTIDLCESWCLRSILNFSEGKGVARSHALHASLRQPRHHSSGSSPHPQRLPLRHCFLSDGGASVVSQLLSFWRQAFGGCRRHWCRWICRNVHSETWLSFLPLHAEGGLTERNWSRSDTSHLMVAARIKSATSNIQMLLQITCSVPSWVG